MLLDRGKCRVNVLKRCEGKVSVGVDEDVRLRAHVLGFEKVCWMKHDVVLEQSEKYSFGTKGPDVSLFIGTGAIHFHFILFEKTGKWGNSLGASRRPLV